MDNNSNNIIVYADKTVLKVHGLDIHGLNTTEVEKLLMDRFKTIVRVIGVTGNSIDMDVYGMDPQQILKDEKGIIKTIAASEGITPLEVAKLSAERIVEVDFNSVKERDGNYCARERWLNND
jgi:hypothetical protein